MALRKKANSKKIKKSLYDDLLEHLEANDAMDLELNFEYPYPEVRKIKKEVAEELTATEESRQQPLPTEWAEYLANNNLRSVGGQNE